MLGLCSSNHENDMSDDSAEPVDVMVLSAGRTSLPRLKLARSLVAAVRDLPGPMVKPDYSFWRFAMFLTAASQRFSNRRGLRLAVTGNVRTRDKLAATLDRVARQKPELLIWWTFIPSLMPGKATTVAEVTERLLRVAQEGVAVIYPSIAGIEPRHPRMFAAGGVYIDGSRLRASAAPAGCIEATPTVVTWDDWEAFRAGWLRFGLPLSALPEASPLSDVVPIGTSRYPLPVWTTAAAVLRSCKGVGPALTVDGLQRILHLCTFPVTVARPDGDAAHRFLDVMHFACFGRELIVRGGG